MKLTEKELKEFPIGTRLLYDKGYLIKTDCKERQKNWYKIGNDGDNGWYGKEYFTKNKFDKVEIPTYTEYIPLKPILDDKEKEYLSGVIKPWRDKIKKIQKREACTGIEFLSIAHQGIYTMAFPYFKAGTMYKGMELDKEYTLEELGL